MNVVYQDPLRIALGPVWDILTDPQTEDLAFNAPHEAWWYKGGRWSPIEAPEMSYRRLHGVSVLAASQARQKIDRRHPILSSDLPGGLRLQSVIPPAVTPGTIALTFRRGDSVVDEISDVTRLFDTSNWNRWGDRHERRIAHDAELLDRFDAGDIDGWLAGVARMRKSGLFCGPTGAGKSRMSRLLGGAVSVDERIITIEDTAELVVRQPNHVRHFYSATGDSASLTAASLVKASLRERPHRIILGEIRDPEAAAVFIDEVMAGHKGSMSTVHGATPAEAARRLFNYFKASAVGQRMDDATIASQLEAAIDFIVPVVNEMGHRSIGQVWYKPNAFRRGERFADLLKE